MADILYEFENIYREKRAIWRLLELPPLRYALARGRTFRWFGIHIPMHLIGMQGDIDIFLSLRGSPEESFKQLYETWEVKSTLVSKDGRVKSSKSSLAKKKQLLGQMKRYRNTGTPYHGLLDLFVHEDQALDLLEGPPREVLYALEEKRRILAEHDFAYRVAMFEHTRELEAGGNKEFNLGLRTSSMDTSTILTLLPGMTREIDNPFMALVERLEDFVRSATGSNQITYGNCVVTYC